MKCFLIIFVFILSLLCSFLVYNYKTIYYFKLLLLKYNLIYIFRPIFRSYKPEDDSLKDSLLDEAVPVNVEQEVKDQLEAAKAKDVIDELDITNLAPRKPDWDLKRDVAKKLEKLERRTQKAIAELIRERLKQRQDLTTIVNAAPSGSN